MKNRIEFKKDKIPFTQVANGVLHDSGLTAKAKGLYAYLYSKPDGWNFAVGRITAEMADGVDSIYAGIKELETNGYLSREKQPDGRTVYSIHFPPMLIGLYPIRENPEQASGANSGKSQFGKIHCISNKDSNKERYTRLASPKRGQSTPTSAASKTRGIKGKAMSKIRGYDENFPRDDVPTVDADSGEHTIYAPKGKNAVATRISQYFFKRASEYTGKKLINTGYAHAKKYLSAGEETLMAVIDEYFDRAPADKDAVNIYKCLNATSINEYVAASTN